MRLIRVSVVLNVEEGKKVDPEIDVLKDFSDDELEETTYAILSHCWDEDKEEVQFKEMQGLTRITGPARQVLRKRRGYQKIVKSCELAHKDGLDWVWVDTCCINKESSSELTEAINSMFRWYSNAKMCYTYLHDVQASCFPTEHDVDNFPNFNGWPKWFSRGWTLQELVAPDTLLFFNREWQPIGNKRCLADTLEQITCIPSRVLAYGMDSYRPSIAQVMSWAADRRTKRVEDRAYSLLGLFGVHMPMLYGEGKNAFRRLQLELIRFTNDHSIFAWDRQHAGWSGSVLADDPSFFRDCDDIVKMEPNEYLAALKGANPDEELHAIPQEPPRTYSVTNAGIQISLPLKRCRGFQSVFEARLACRHSPDSSPISIVLASFQSTYYRAFGDFEPMLGTTAQFQPLYLAYREEKRRSDFTFKFDDSAVSCDGFVQRCIFPDRVMSNDNSITLRNTNDRAIIVYAKDSVNTCFAVAVGYSLGHEWVHVVCDDPLEESNPSTWKAYAEQVYKRMWTASPEHAQRMAQAWQTATFERHSSVFHLVQHAHLPQSLSGVRIVCKQLPQPQMGLVTIDVVRCTGCCIAPGVWQTLNGFSSNGLDTPGLMIDGAATRGAVHRLLVDAVPTPFTSSLGEPGIKLGDYGDWDGIDFVPQGNIFTDMKPLAARLHIDPRDHILRPVKHEIRCRNNANKVIDPVISIEFNSQLFRWEGLALSHPKGFSLPTHQHVVSLLKALSYRLENKCLITTVVHCSDCHFSESNNIKTIRKKRPKHNHGDVGCWKKLPITTPLYIPMKPLVWQGERAHENTRTYFERIRKHFHALLNAKATTHNAKPSGDKGGEVTKDAAIRFFSNIFGGGHFKDYIGDITCFELTAVAEGTWGPVDRCGNEQPHIATSKSHHIADENSLRLSEHRPVLSDGSVAALQVVSDVGDEGKTVHNSCVEELAATLLRRMSISTGESVDKRIRTCEAEELGSKSFGMEILQTVSAVYQRSPEFLGSSSGEEGDLDMDHVNTTRDNIRSLVQDVKTLEEKLFATQVDDERRALEDDITGKILLAYWKGICSEIEQIVEKVIRRIVNDGSISRSEQEERSKNLQQDGMILEKATAAASDDDQSHLRRILADAEAGISKYELLRGS